MRRPRGRNEIRSDRQKNVCQLRSDMQGVVWEGPRSMTVAYSTCVSLRCRLRMSCGGLRLVGLLRHANGSCGCKLVDSGHVGRHEVQWFSHRPRVDLEGSTLLTMASCRSMPPLMSLSLQGLRFQTHARVVSRAASPLSLGGVVGSISSQHSHPPTYTRSKNKEEVQGSLTHFHECMRTWVFAGEEPVDSPGGRC